MSKHKGSKRRVDDAIKLRGCIELALYGPHINEGPRLAYQKADAEFYMFPPVAERKADNTVSAPGRNWVLKKIIETKFGGETTNYIAYIAIGSNTATAPASTQSALVGEATRITVSTIDTTGMITTAAPSFVAQCTFDTATGNNTTSGQGIGEAGLFNSSSAGTMLSRVTFTTIAKTTSNTLAISYTISN